MGKNKIAQWNQVGIEFRSYISQSQYLKKERQFLSFLLSFLVGLLLPIHCRCRWLLMHLITLNDTHPGGHLLTRDRPGAHTPTWQPTTFTTDIHAPGGKRVFHIAQFSHDKLHTHTHTHTQTKIASQMTMFTFGSLLLLCVLPDLQSSAIEDQRFSFIKIRCRFSFLDRTIRRHLLLDSKFKIKVYSVSYCDNMTGVKRK
jgi:hypothetical protein